MTPTPPASTSKLQVRRFTLGPYQTNCYVVRPADLDRCWIVDASFGPGPIIEFVRAGGLNPEALILTHAHIDHIAGVAEIRGAFPKVPILIHALEAAWLNDPVLNLSDAAGMPTTAPGPDRTLADGDELSLGTTQWRVLHTPGHSPGSIALHCPGAGVLISGDALFAGSIGRTDFPGCSLEQLEASIRGKLYVLPAETQVLPGHGPGTTIGREMSANPYVRA